MGNALHNWWKEIPMMFQFARNGGITEGFHRKMKLILWRAYGFRNFEITAWVYALYCEMAGKLIRSLLENCL